MDESISAVVLAAGKGTRMNAPHDKNKVVFNIGNKPIISHTLDMLKICGFQSIIVVIGHAADSVKQTLGNQVTYAVQDNPQGTGHAVMVALPYLPPTCDTIVCMYGDDSAFYPPLLIQSLIHEHQAHRAVVTVVTLDKANPTGLGRIVRDDATHQIRAIVEEKNATDTQKSITEINTGLYCFEKTFLNQAIRSIEKNPISNEYYLTDVIGNAVKSNQPVHILKWPTDDIWFGVNTPEQLSEAEARMIAKIR